jgi:hypothetical protein
MRRQNPNLDAALEAYAGGMTWKKIKIKFKIGPEVLANGIRAQGIPMRRSKRNPAIQAAIIAYDAGESAASIQARTGIPNQTLYYHRRKRGLKTHIAKRTKPTCWSCGKRVGDNSHKTCGNPECMRKAGIALPWSDRENAVVEAGIIRRLKAREIAQMLPDRTLEAVELRIRKTKREMRKLAVAA